MGWFSMRLRCGRLMAIGNRSSFGERVMTSPKTSRDTAASSLRIGTSGWNYPAWKNGFYEGIPRRRWLAHAAETFNGLEVNGTFYREIKRSTLESWRDQVPEGFAFAVKGHRVVTHSHKLRDTEASLERQRDALAVLGDRLDVMLWQTPASLDYDTERLEAFLGALREVWPNCRHAIEFRRQDWFTEEAASLLSNAGVANTISDAGKWPRWDAVTTDLAYVRLHGAPETYKSLYGEEALQSWAAQIRRWRDEGRSVHVYFDNTEAPATQDALRLKEILGV